MSGWLAICWPDRGYAQNPSKSSIDALAFVYRLGLAASHCPHCPYVGVQTPHVLWQASAAPAAKADAGPKVPTFTKNQRKKGDAAANTVRRLYVACCKNGDPAYNTLCQLSALRSVCRRSAGT